MKNSVIFWNLLHLLVVVVVGLISVDALYIIMILSFLFSLGIMFDAKLDGGWTSKWFAIHINPGTIGLVGFVSILAGLGLIVSWVFDKCGSFISDILDK